MTKECERLRQQVLQEQAASRRAIGLSENSCLSVLQLAALYKPALAKELVAQGHECDLPSSCALGDIDRIKVLATEPALSQPQEHLTPMGWAILKGQCDSVDALLRCGDHPERPLQRIGFFEWEMQALGSVRWYPVHAASTHGYHESAPKIVQSLVKAGANIEKLSPLGCTPLGLACIYSWTHVIDTLLRLGANINARSERETNLVWRLSAPANAKRSVGQTPLMIAAGEGQAAAVNLLLKQGCDTSLRDGSGMSALHIAASPWWKEEPKIVEMLLAAGMDSNASNEKGETPLELAGRKGLKETYRLLAGSN